VIGKGKRQRETNAASACSPFSYIELRRYSSSATSFMFHRVSILIELFADEASIIHRTLQGPTIVTLVRRICRKGVNIRESVMQIDVVTGRVSRCRC
jgi:hypothetical protein